MPETDVAALRAFRGFEPSGRRIPGRCGTPRRSSASCPAPWAASGAASRARLARVRFTGAGGRFPCLAHGPPFPGPRVGVGDEVRVSVHEIGAGVHVVEGAVDAGVSHVGRQIGQHRHHVHAVASPPLDVREREPVPEIIGPGPFAGLWPLEPGPRPDAAEHHAGHARGDRIAGGGDEERGTVVSEAFAGPLVAFQQFGGDLVAHGQPAAATGLGIDHVDGTGLVVDVPDGESPDLSGAQPAAGHEHEERARLPRPRRRRLQRSRGPQEQGGLAVRQQVRRRTRGSGLPLVGEHVRVGIVGQSHPPAEVPDVREPRAATPGIRVDPMGDPSLHDAPLQTHGPVFEAMPVERAQDLDAGGAMPAHGRLETDVLLQFAGERADESVFRGSHDDPPSGTGSTHASIPPRCVAM